ncbi:MAG: VOC family protein [Actinomycetota bacterium]|nr:VOC family protein [Actinomycetota bacterium]
MITAMPRIAIVVNDFERAVTTFRDVFGMPVVDFSPRTVPDLGGHVGMCQPPGGSNIELMAPSDPGAPLSRAMQKFLDARGDGLYALMLEAPEPNAEAVELEARGMDVLPLMAGAAGRDVHPRSTHGVLIRVYPDGSVAPGTEASREPGLTGISTVIIATKDATAAADTYRHGLGLAVDAPCYDPDRGVTVARCHPAKGGSIELLSAVDTANPFAAEIDRFVTDTGGGMYALVLEADDTDRAVATLRERGVTFGGSTGRMVSIFGTRLIIGR